MFVCCELPYSEMNRVLYPETETTSTSIEPKHCAIEYPLTLSITDVEVGSIPLSVKS
jgi:hypothetical protein